jgi:hypothetical protein
MTIRRIIRWRVLRWILLALIVLALGACQDRGARKTSVDVPTTPLEWKFITLTWRHPTQTENGSDLPIGEIEGYYILFTDLITSQVIDFEIGVFEKIIVSVPPGVWRTELFTLDINGYVSDSAYIDIDELEFNDYDGLIVTCSSPYAITACVSENPSYYFDNC